MQQKAFIYIHVLLNEGLVKAQNKPMFKMFWYKSKDYSMRASAMTIGKVLQWLLCIAT